VTTGPLALLCAGAAKGLVAAVGPAFTTETGVAIDGTYGAVGALVEKLKGGARCDAIVLTAALITCLEKEGFVVPGTTAPLGSAATAIAVARGSPRPAIGDAGALHATLVGATRLYFPDPERATAGIHFKDVLRRLGIADMVSTRCATFESGAAAMAALAGASDRGAIGCTQATEIVYTPGVELIGTLPPGFALATLYSAAVCRRAGAPEAAQRLIAMLAGPASRETRERCGFGPV
jgi:molybdate transport system substrate-binding protein